MTIRDEFLNKVAKLCHQCNKAICENNGDNSQEDWENAPDWARKSSIDGVIFGFSQAGAFYAGQCHENWVQDKVSDGWVYGEKKSQIAKTHPCMVPFGELPDEQKLKDYVFVAIVKFHWPLWLELLNSKEKDPA